MMWRIYAPLLSKKNEDEIETNMTKLAVMIDGGLGRVLCAIPALQELNKKHDLIVLTGGWEYAYSGSGLTVLPLGKPGLQTILDGYPVVKPEPYWNLDYRAGKANLVEAFFAELNLTVPKGEVLPYNPDLRHMPASIYSEKPILMIQPHGSGGEADSRSMTRKELVDVVNKYRQEYSVFIIGTEVELKFEDESVQQIKNIAEPVFIRYMQIADLIVSCDSAGLHIAAAMGTPHVAYLSSTSGVKYYRKTSKIVREGFKDMRINPRL